MVGNENNDSFREFKQLFLKLIVDVEKIHDEQVRIRIDQGVMKVKIAFWGAVGAVIGMGFFNLIIWAIQYFITYKKP